MTTDGEADGGGRGRPDTSEPDRLLRRPAGGRRARVIRGAVVWLRRVWLVAFWPSLCLVLLECFVRIGSCETSPIRRTLGYQVGDISIHRVASDHFLRYELIPGSSGTFVGGEPTPRQYTVHVNRHGARGREYPVEKSPGLFRIVCVGGSTMYGAGVADDETIAARLEVELAKHIRTRGPDDQKIVVESWNFGVNGYNLAQAAYLARQKIALLKPDLIVVQEYNNGARLLHGDLLQDEFDACLDDDPELVAEYYPPPRPSLRSAHEALFGTSMLYRLLAAAARLDSSLSLRPVGTARELTALLDQAADRDVGVVFLKIPACGVDPKEDVGRSTINLNEPGREDAFSAVHPPAEYLAEWADKTARWIADRGWLPGADRGPLPGADRRREDGRILERRATDSIVETFGHMQPDVELDGLQLRPTTARARVCTSPRYGGSCYTIKMSDPTHGCLDSGCRSEVAGPWCLVFPTCPDEEVATRIIEELTEGDDPWSLARENDTAGPGPPDPWAGTSWATILTLALWACVLAGPVVLLTLLGAVAGWLVRRRSMGRTSGEAIRS